MKKLCAGFYKNVRPLSVEPFGVSFIVFYLYQQLEELIQFKKV